MVIDIHARFTQHPLELHGFRGLQVSMLAKPKKSKFSIGDEAWEA